MSELLLIMALSQEPEPVVYYPPQADEVELLPWWVEQLREKNEA